MCREELDLSVSHDGLPGTHDRHRRRADGSGTAADVLETIHRLQDVGPTAAYRYSRGGLTLLKCCPRGSPGSVGKESGVSILRWTLGQLATCDMPRLERALGRLADVWLAGLPEGGINWLTKRPLTWPESPSSRPPGAASDMAKLRWLPGPAVSVRAAHRRGPGQSSLAFGRPRA